MTVSAKHVDSYSVTDCTGQTIELDRPAQRIVCLSASGLDVVLELGLEPVGGLRAGVAECPEFYGRRSPQWPNIGSWLLPTFSTIRQTRPDLIIGWRFPHCAYRPWLRKSIAPVYLMGSSGYEAAILRLLDVAYLTDRTAVAELAIAAVERQLQTFSNRIRDRPPKTVLAIGGSAANCWLDIYPVETECGTLGSILKRFVRFPWSKRHRDRGEPGLTYLSLRRVLDIANPDVIFVQSYGREPLSQQLDRHPIWNQFEAVKARQVYEIPPYWHWGNGTRLIRVMLHAMLPLIYPDSFAEPPLRKGLRQRELCDRMGFNYKDVAKAAKMLGLSTHLYIQQQTAWQLYQELYYPPGQFPSAIL
ncbi:MAG: ABC transporter substrate-binding protein [Cyanobacteria bacterium J06639_1]